MHCPNCTSETKLVSFEHIDKWCCSNEVCGWQEGYPPTLHLDQVDKMFDFSYGNKDHYQTEFKKAQELLNYVDKIRTFYGNKLVQARK